MGSLSVEQAVALLQADDVVAIPTETVYGLAGRIDSPLALKKIFAVKERPFFDPLIVHVLDLEDTQSLVHDWPAVLSELAEAFWPGPLTLVLEKSARIDDLITSGLPTVAVRSPSHPLARAILKATGPLAAPSANRFGKTSPTTAAHVQQEFSRIGVVDGGACEIGLESTVVSLSEAGALQILRPGRVLRTDLQPFADKYGLRLEVGSNIKSPGHLPHHYQPEVPLVLLRKTQELEQLRSALKAEFSDRSELSLQFLQLPDQPREAARRLYSELRKLSENPNHIIVADPSRWHWQEDASDLMDRLSRAASVTF